MARGWEGDLVRLVPLDKEKHLQNAVEWMNDPEVTEWLERGDFPMTHLEEEAFFDRVSQPATTDVVFAIETLEGVHLGFSGTHGIDWRNRVGTTGSFIGRKDFWGKRYGSDAVRVRTRYLFEVLGLRLLLAAVMAGNERSLRMLNGSGYREVGRIPGRWWKRGEYRDEILLAADRTSWTEAIEKEPAAGPTGGPSR